MMPDDIPTSQLVFVESANGRLQQEGTERNRQEELASCDKKWAA